MSNFSAIFDLEQLLEGSHLSGVREALGLKDFARAGALKCGDRTQT